MRWPSDAYLPKRDGRKLSSYLTSVDADQVLAFRLVRSGLAVRSARTLAEAAACPASTRPAGPASRRREGIRPERGARRGDDGHEGCAGAGPDARQERAPRGTERARPRRPDALVSGLREPPRRSDAVALRHGEGGRSARLRAPLHEGGAGPNADRQRGRSPLLGFYGPAKPGDFAEWAGLGKPHAHRLWDDAAGDLAEVQSARTTGGL